MNSLRDLYFLFYIYEQVPDTNGNDRIFYFTEGHFCINKSIASLLIFIKFQKVEKFKFIFNLLKITYL